MGSVMVCSPVMCEGSGRGVSAGKGSGQAMSASVSGVVGSVWWRTHSEVCVRVCAYGEGAARFVTWAFGLARRQLCVQHHSPVPLDAVAPQGNNNGPAGMRPLRPALEKMTNLTELGLSRTCGYVQQCSTQ